MKPNASPSQTSFVTAMKLEDLPDPPAGSSGWPWTQSSPAPSQQSEGQPWPPIGIVTPSYNQGRFIEQTIRSILLQGYPALEYYVIDGGSTDQTKEILQKYDAFLPGWVSEADQGQSQAINKGMARLKEARWVNWINSDDMLLPGALEAVGKWAAESREAVAVVGRGRHYLVKERKTIPATRRDDLDGVKLRNWCTHSFLQPACFFSMKEFDACGGLNEDLHYAMDFDLWVKLGEKGRFELIDTLLAQDSRHEDAKTHDGMGRYYGEACESLFNRGHHQHAKQMINDLYERYAYLARLTRPISENPLYKKFIQPWVRRRAPDHMKKT